MPDISQGIIDFALHPPLGSLTQHLDGAGPYTGNVTLTTWSTTVGPIYSPEPVTNTFGVYSTVNGLIPTDLGYELGYIDPLGFGEEWFHKRLVQIVVQHQLASGAWVTTQSLEQHTVQGLLMWDVALPGRIGLYTLPGIAIDLYYLKVF